MIWLDQATAAWPRPAAVGEAVASALALPPAEPHAPSSAGRAVRSILDEARARVAGLLGVRDPERVILAASGTDALNMALKGLLEPGDHVVASTLDRDAIARPLTHLQMGGRIVLARLSADADGRLDPAALAAAVGPRTRLVVLTHASPVLGTVQPMAELIGVVRRGRARVLVDVTHTVGCVPLDVSAWGADLVACAGSIGLFAPTGVGVLALGPDMTLRPWREGTSGADPTLPLMPLELPWRLEAGSANLAAIAGLGAGAAFVAEQGPRRIGEREQALIRRLIGALGLDDRFRLFAARGDIPRVGLVSFTIPGLAPAAVASRLEAEFDVVVQAGLHGAALTHDAL